MEHGGERYSGLLYSCSYEVPRFHPFEGADFHRRDLFDAIRTGSFPSRSPEETYRAA